jgi:hypothetical protein
MIFGNRQDDVSKEISLKRNITQYLKGLPRHRNDLNFDVDISRGFSKTSRRFFFLLQKIRREQRNTVK